MSDDDVAGRLKKAIPGLSVEYFGGACPTQGEGVCEAYPGLRWYFRYRWDLAALYVFDPRQGHHTGTQWYAEKVEVLGNPLYGCLNDDEAVEVFTCLWGELRPRSQVETTQVERFTEQMNALLAHLAANPEIVSASSPESEPPPTA